MPKKIAITITCLMIFFIFLNLKNPGFDKQDNEGNSVEVPDTAINDYELGYRKTSLFDEEKVELDKTLYSKLDAGSSSRIERAYENAPPMIPHNLDDMVPIISDDNWCIGCHMPEDDIETQEATPIPKSHFREYRPEYVITNGVPVMKLVDLNVIEKNLGNVLSNARFNCMQCHVPQAEFTKGINNLFIPEFRDTLSKKRSNLVDVIGEGVK